MLVGMPQPDGFVVQGAAGGAHTDRLHMGSRQELCELYDIEEHNRNIRFRGSGGRDEFRFGRAERPEGAFGLGLTHPVVDAGEIDVLPDLR